MSPSRAEFIEDGVGVLALVGAGGVEPARGAAEGHRLADQLDIPQLGMVNRLGDAEMLDLRVGEDLIHLVDRPRRHPGLVEPVDPFGAGVQACDLLDRRVQCLAVGRARAASLVVGVLRQIGHCKRAAQPAENLVAS
jgi:hypothetical protein